jgi:hypothetical protein
METQNITLSLPKRTLRKIKILAVQRQTSVSKLLIQALETMVAEETGYNEARKRQKLLMQKGFPLGFEEFQTPSREDLHER